MITKHQTEGDSLDRNGHNARSQGPALPKGVNGIDLGELVLVLARNKLVFTPKGTREHYTLHLGPDSKVIDLHKTILRADGTSEHLTLFSIPHGRLIAMMEELALPFFELLMGLARPLSPTWMDRRRVRAVVGLLPAGPDAHAVGRVRHRKFGIDPKKLAARTWAPDCIDELYKLDGKIFTLFMAQKNRGLRKIGYGFPVTDARRKHRLLWIPDRSLAEAMQRGSALLTDTAAKYGVFTASPVSCA